MGDGTSIAGWSLAIFRPAIRSCVAPVTTRNTMALIAIFIERGLAVKAQVKDQWVKDLRSGQFEQGNGVLRRDNGEGEKDSFCCLGVLTEQAVRAGVIPAPELHNGVYRYLDDEQDGYSKVTGEGFKQECVLPRKVAEWAGLLHEDGTAREDVIIIPAEDEESCDFSGIEANDGVGESFAVIADLIEKNVPGE